VRSHIFPTPRLEISMNMRKDHAILHRSSVLCRNDRMQELIIF
jgi:hypothetical protein